MDLFISRRHCLAAVLALAGSLPLPYAAARDRGSFSFDATGISESAVKDHGAEISKQIYSLRAGYAPVGLRIKHTVYGFSGSERYISDTDQVVIDARYGGKLDKGWGWFAGAGYGIGYEEDIHFSENWQLLLAAGVSAPLGETTQGFLGAATILNEARNKFTPIIGIKFGNPEDLGWSGGIAYPYTKATYRFDPVWSVELCFDSTKDLVQLRDDSQLAPRGYVMEESNDIGLQVNLTPDAGVHLHAGIRYYFSREFELFNSAADSTGEYELDPAWGIYAGVNIGF